MGGDRVDQFHHMQLSLCTPLLLCTLFASSALALVPPGTDGVTEAPSTPQPASNPSAPLNGEEAAEQNAKAAPPSRGNTAPPNDNSQTEQSAAEGDARKSILVLKLRPIQVEKGQVDLIDGLVARILSDYAALNVVTASDIRMMLDVEADRAKMECSKEECVAEIAGAMNTQYVIYGQVGKLGSLTLIQFNLFDSYEAKAIGRSDVQVDDFNALPDHLQAAIDRLLQPLLPQTARAPQATPASPPGASHTDEAASPFSSPLFLGGAAAAAGGLTLAAAMSTWAGFMERTLADPAAPTAEKDSALTFVPVAVITAGVGGVGALIGAGAMATSLVLE